MDQVAIRPKAFGRDARAYGVAATAKALWWSANRAIGQAYAARGVREPERPPFRAPAPPSGRLREAWLEAFRKEAADVAAGLYPVAEPGPAHPFEPVLRAADVIGDGRVVSARRRRGGAVEARDEPAASASFPPYYRQNFHFQTGGWFTQESAERYEAQVEALFSGAAGAMRRRALALLAQAWRDRDQRGLRIVDVGCGSGAFLNDLRVAFPRATSLGLDLSHAYLSRAKARMGVGGVQAAAERLPFADASLDAVSCIYLFHELPPKVRQRVAAELARVLKPGGYLAFADSAQRVDAPDMGRLFEAFPAFFHEPFYESYQETDLESLFGVAGLAVRGRDIAFLTKALLLQKAPT